MAASSFEKRREAFGERLRGLRADAGFVTGKDFARALGWNAPKVSKIENGRQTASAEDLDAWLTAASAAPDDVEQLRAMLTGIHEAYITWKDRVRAGHRARQEESVDREARARVIRAFEVVVPGLLQTPEYARHILTAHAELHGGRQDITEAVRSRMKRQQILFEPGRKIELLISESALRHPIAPREIMLGQIHRLIASIGMPDVRVGIVPLDVQLPYPLLHGWWIIDDVVLVETVTAELTIDDPDELAVHSRLIDMLWEVAAEGDKARDILAAAARA
ncbi:helix-turn-helix domain-containing protein [Amycolatopsis azurea]|uniref:Putative DNA-binding protein n=1 Tax=Amycolatopsis azurea DSM 43854 TaxID=1238180 RepID=M2QA70_9PSEU|nr:helix-turn-helix transcriptional regulator [Amycolatopsis azurea]EMD22937.1 putative DNA-binding protein [Amycolatopsis azurea DSM 43854]OOC04299.1 transcriptional regulator [Amycolatopsis azurea DSM 43854]